MKNIAKTNEEVIVYLNNPYNNCLKINKLETYYKLKLTINEGESLISDQIIYCKTGQLILTAPNITHQKVLKNNTSDERNLESDIVILFKDNPIKQITNNFPEAKELAHLLELANHGVEIVGFKIEYSKELLYGIRDNTGMSRLLIFLELMHELNRWPEKRVLSTSKPLRKYTEIKDSKINEIINYIKDNYKNDFCLRDVSKMANMSESTFSRRFQQETSSKFVEYVNRVRIHCACILLQESNEKVSTICYEVGFKNISNFNRQFFNLKGQTPTEYRNKFQYISKNTKIS